jgi:hypothetical protein
LHEALPVPLSAREKALQQLRELQNKKLLEKNLVKEYYAELSLIIREYLEVKYGIPALESTTLETLTLLSGNGFPKVKLPMLKDILQKTDLVKYAKSEPPNAQHEAVIELAKEFVMQEVSKNTPPTDTGTRKYPGPNNDSEKPML